MIGMRWFNGLMIWLATTVFPVAAQNDMPELIWCLDHFHPFHNYQDDTPTGPSVQIMQEIARRSGFIVTYSDKTPLSRCLRQMELGEVDLMSNLKFSPERERYIWLLPYRLVQPEKLLQRRDDDRLFNHPHELDPLTLVTIRGFAYNQALMQVLDNRINKVTVDTIEVGLELLLIGRVDGLLIPPESALPLIVKHKRFTQQFKLADLPIYQDPANPIHIGLSRASKHQHVKQRIEHAITSMQQDGTLDRLHQPSEYVERFFENPPF